MRSLAATIGRGVPELDPRIPAIAYDTAIDPFERLVLLEDLWPDASRIDRAQIAGYVEMLAMEMEARAA